MAKQNTTGTPSPQTTIIILLGASQWPHDATFKSSDAFKEAADEIEAYFAGSFQVPKEHILRLFNTDLNAIQICNEIHNHLKRFEKDAKDVLVYYVGHAKRTMKHSQLYLAIQDTQKRDPEGTSLKIEQLARAVSRAAPNLRRFYIFDCCFAASAISDLQGVSEEDLARDALNDVETGNQQGGFVALCSSNISEPSVILPGHTNTYFTKALLQVLKQGNKSSESALSFNSLCNAINSELLKLREEYASSSKAEKPPFAVIFAGSIANIPFFPNSAYLPSPEPENSLLPSRLQQQPTSTTQFSPIKGLTQSGRLMVCAIVFIFYWLTMGYTTPKIFPEALLHISGSTYLRMLFVGNSRTIRRLKVIIIFLILVIDWYLAGTLLTGIPNINFLALPYVAVSNIAGIVLISLAVVIFGIFFVIHLLTEWPYLNVINYRKVLEVLVVTSLLSFACQIQVFGVAFLYFPILAAIVSFCLFLYGVIPLGDTSYIDVLRERKRRQESLENESEDFFREIEENGGHLSYILREFFK